MAVLRSVVESEAWNAVHAQRRLEAEPRSKRAQRTAGAAHALMWRAIHQWARGWSASGHTGRRKRSAP